MMCWDCTPSDEVAGQRAGEERVFALVLEGAAVARLAGQVDAAAERHAVALVAQFAADERAVLEGGLRIPGGGGAEVVGQRGGVAARSSAARDAIGGVGHLDGGNAEARNGGGEAGAAVGLGGGRRAGRRRHALAVQQRDLLVEGHLFDDHVGALVGREGWSDHA